MWHEFLEVRAFLERNVIEEAQGGNGDHDGAGCQFLFVRQIELIGAVCSGASSSGDLLKCRAKSETCRT